MSNPNANEYIHLSEHNRVLKSSDIYIGSSERIPRTVSGFKDGKLFKMQTMIAEGLVHIFLEVLGNAADNVQRSRDQGFDPKVIEVEITESRVKVINYGRWIPVEQKNGVYIPQLIFGTIGTSSNYERIAGTTYIGKNGIGAKAANIFSKAFEVKCDDPARKLRYRARWTKNMFNVKPPVIEQDANLTEGRTEVTFCPDFPRFQQPAFCQEDLWILAAHCAEVSLTRNIPVYFNGQKIHYKNISEYANSFFDDNVNKIFHEGPEYQLCIADTPNEAIHTSFVNGVLTCEGGIHLDNALRAALTVFNEQNLGIKLTKTHVQNHLSVIIACNLHDPKFKSQTKSYLTGPDFKIDIPKSKLGKIKKWKMSKEIMVTVNKWQIKKLKETDGKSTKSRILDPKIIDANFAGKDMKNCVLLLTEGDSAKQYGQKFISHYKDAKGRCFGPDYFGIIPLKGVPLNSFNANFQRLLVNQEFTSIKKFMGLKDEVKYGNNREYNKLRYGQIWLMVDADVDGKHIAGLLLLFFMHRFPELVERGAVSLFRTPIIRSKKGKLRKRFYTDGAFNQWVNSGQAKGWTHKYYKGLASNEPEDIKEDFAQPRLVNFRRDDAAMETLLKVFDKQRAEDRKRWLAEFVEDSLVQLEDTNIIDISLFIDKEMIHHAMAANIRCIPQIDGFKEAIRKVYFCQSKFFSAKKSEIKVLSAANIAINECLYKYGPTSMQDAICNSTIQFVGSNNEPLFHGAGIFGSRDTGKNNSAPRYISIAESWWTKYLFRKEDERILVRDVEEDEQIEYKCYYPILPSILFNTVTGIGTAYSTDIPSFYPPQIAKWYLMRLKQPTLKLEELEEMVPWYRGHTGEIKRRVKESGFVSEGRFHMTPEGAIVITELPARCWTSVYRKFLITLVTNKVITEFVENSDADGAVNFTLFGWSLPTAPDLKNLKLIKRFSFANIVIMEYTDFGLRPRRFANVAELMEYFFNIRLIKYKERKMAMLAEWAAEKEKLSERHRYIKGVITGEIRVMKVPKADVLAQLKSLEFKSYAHVREVTTIMLTKEELEKLETKIAQLTESITTLVKTPIRAIWASEIMEYITAYEKRNGPHMLLKYSGDEHPVDLKEYEDLPSEPEEDLEELDD